MLKILLRAFLILRLERQEFGCSLEGILGFLRHRIVAERVMDIDGKIRARRLRHRIEEIFPW